ncbi:MAG: group II intron reverse transcriptase/maturase, partial [Acidobacteriota bacterium]|nr:group II intron reverse transcriptase/maturase [Acidobacteriota bacterium]
YGLMFGRNGKSHVGWRPSKKAVLALYEKIRKATSRQTTCLSIENRIEALNLVLRGWSNYFDQGPVRKLDWRVQLYSEQRIQRWLKKKHKHHGAGYKQYPIGYLYETLGLYRLQAPILTPSNAKP